MTRTPDELAAAIATHADPLPLTDEQLRAQSYPVDLQRWQDRWPDGLPVPGRVSEAAQVQVARGELLDLGRSVQTEADAVELYVLLGGWAIGYLDLSATRTLRPLHDDGTATALLRATRLVRKGRAVHAYESLWRGENRIKRVGPPLFTAWLYVTAHEQWDAEHGPAPLVLDHRVAKAVGWSGARVSAAAYGRYLQLADETARLLSDRTGRAVTAHAVENALMVLGG